MKNVYHIVILTFIALFFSAVCCQNSNESDASTKVDYDKLNKAFEAGGGINGIKSLTVSKNGSILKESYYNSAGKEIQQDVRSVTKSIIGLLIGIAIDRGIIKSIDESIGEYLNPILDKALSPEKSKITIRHLLIMSSGLPWRELGVLNSEYSEWVNSPNQVNYMIEKTPEALPGQYFNYNTGAIHILSVILTLSSGEKTIDFAQKYLFDSIGINKNASLRPRTQLNFEQNEGFVTRNWITDRQGYNNGGAGLSLTPQDMIKIGNLILNKGLYEGKRIVSSSWIDEINKTQIATLNPIPYGSGYSYGWWTGRHQGYNFTMAMGWGGQFIVVFPDLNLVITATCNWQNISSTTGNTQWSAVIDLIMNNILPAFI